MDASPQISRGATAAFVFVGGGLGAMLRWSLADLPTLQGTFPLATLAANLAGATFLGYLAGAVERRPGRGVGWPFLGVGLAGALTTFSTFAVESVDLLASSGAADALLYAGGSVLAGLWLAASARRFGARA